MLGRSRRKRRTMLVQGRPELARQLQDETTRAWNLHIGLYSRVGATPGACREHLRTTRRASSACRSSGLSMGRAYGRALHKCSTDAASG